MDLKDLPQKIYVKDLISIFQNFDITPSELRELYTLENEGRFLVYIKKEK